MQIIPQIPQILQDFCIPILIIFSLILIKKYVNGAYCKIHKNLIGQNIIITGCNTGIGYQTALRLAQEGAHIICACRSKERAQPLIDDITQKYGKNRISFEKLDLNDLDQIKQFSEQIKQKYKQIDTLINNAGVLCLLDPERKVTKQGFEIQWGVNYLGHFYLTHLLLELIENSGEGRIINVSSDYHLPFKACQNSGIIIWDDINQEKNYIGFAGYSQSKLANIMHAKELSKRFQNKNIKIKAFSLHPGCVDTTISKNIGNGNKILKYVYNVIKPLFSKLVLKDTKYGAQTSIYCALQDFSKLQSGGYYEECKLSKSSKLSHDIQQSEKLWIYTHNTLQITPYI